MKTATLIITLLLIFTACNHNPVYLSGDLRPGEMVSGVLSPGIADTFKLDVTSGTFFYGIADQVSVDVVVTMYDSAGVVMGRFDGPGTGQEWFYFETADAGRYLLEVAPFKEDSGEYTIEIKIVEPVATDPAKRTDQLFMPYSGDDIPGGVIGVMQDGKMIFEKAYGMADLTDDRPFTVNTPSNIGSVSKQFTAYAILMLEQEGKISLEDDIREYIPELPDLGQVITIKNLLNHTNGFREVYNLMPMTGWKSEDFLRSEDVIKMLCRQKELQAAPGEVYNYNNSAFILLAEVVKRISGTEFPEWMKSHIFDPLGMESTMVRRDPRTIIPGASRGYTLDSKGYREAEDLYAAVGAGGIYTTAADFNRWLNNFHDPVIGGEDLVRKLVTPDTLNNGDTLSYALGIGVGEYKGLKIYRHGGADIAHRAMLLYFPEINAGVAVLSNNAGFATDRIVYSVADVFFGSEMTDEPEEKEHADSSGVSIPPEILENYAGRYRLTDYGVVLNFVVKNDRLLIAQENEPEVELVPVSRNIFKLKDSETNIDFKTGTDGKVIKAAILQDGMTYELLPFEPYKPASEELMAFEGRYFSDEIETFYDLEAKDSVLVIHLRNTEDISLTPVKKDAFKSDVYYISNLEFSRDDRGKIDGFTVSNGRTKGVIFNKL